MEEGERKEEINAAVEEKKEPQSAENEKKENNEQPPQQPPQVEKGNEKPKEESDDEEEVIPDNERIKMVLVARSDLKMGTGKIAAQVAHAAVDLALSIQPPSPFYETVFVPWDKYGVKKVVLKVNSEEKLIELYKTAKEIGLPCTIIQDAGRTQIAAGSRTVMGIVAPEALVNVVTGHLPLY